jgi:carboxymethylenebutenolidase
MMDHITVKGQGGTFLAYIARPETLPAPAVVVLQELFGLNTDIRKTCDELAEQGFLAVTPDLFWRQEPGVDLNVTSEADWQPGLRLYGAYYRDLGVKDVRDTINAIRDLPECDGTVEGAGGVHISYDRMASLLAPYGNADVLKVARDLDAKLEDLLQKPAG